nr:translation initiation factor IF-2-like [Aegilops tauschii subsp. strangulata]
MPETASPTHHHQTGAADATCYTAQEPAEAPPARKPEQPEGRAPTMPPRTTIPTRCHQATRLQTVAGRPTFGPPAAKFRIRPLQARGRPPPVPPATPPAIDLDHLQIHHARSTDDIPTSRRRGEAEPLASARATTTLAGPDLGRGRPEPSRAGITGGHHAAPAAVAARRHRRAWAPPPQLLGAEPCHGTAARSSMPPPRRRVDLEDISLQPGTSRPCPAPKAALPPPSLGQPELRWDEPSGGGGTRGGGEECCGG